MRFLLSLLSLLIITSHVTGSLVDPSPIMTEHGIPHVVGLHESHNNHHGRFKVLSTTESDYVDSPPAPPAVETVGVIVQNDFNPIGSHDVVIEYSGTRDGYTHVPWTVSVDAEAELFHYSCITGGEERSTWRTSMGDIVNQDMVADFFAEYNNYKHPRQIPRIQCVFPNNKYRTQVHLRHLGQRSGDIQCTSSPLVEMAKQMAEVAGCITN